MYLPRGAGAAGAQEVARAPEFTAALGNERILIVEDKPDVRQVAVYLLRSLGYLTETAENAEAALAILDRGEPFDLLFTDIVMPGKMTGIDLAHEVKRRFPRMAVVFTSGFSNPETTIGQVAALGATVISKPYNKAKLGTHLRAVFDRATARAGA
jgi:CheY-like chemotaxis protein